MGIKNKFLTIYSQYKNHGLKSVLNKFDATFVTIGSIFGAIVMFHMIQYSSTQLPLIGIQDMFKENGTVELFLKFYFSILLFLNMSKDFLCFKEEKVVSMDEVVSYLKNIKDRKQQSNAIWKIAEYITNNKNHNLTQSNFDIIVSKKFESAKLDPQVQENKSFYYNIMKILNEQVYGPRSFIYVKEGGDWKVKDKVEHIH